MQVDRGAFLMFVTSLALGGAAGYVASEKDLVPHMKPPAPPPPPAVAEPPKVVDAGPPPPPAVVVVDAGPTCDDSFGTPEPCPPMGLPTVEGGCGALPLTRCNDFKQTMKPKVAAAAIACLNKLNFAERCDPKRIDLCAHFALMNSCEDKSPTSTVTTGCTVLEKTCASAPGAAVPIAQNECRVVMSGLREIGREAMLDCAKKHCVDKGILGCEATGVPVRFGQ